jgi:hypothetical protein
LKERNRRKKTSYLTYLVSELQVLHNSQSCILNIGQQLLCVAFQNTLFQDIQTLRFQSNTDSLFKFCIVEASLKHPLHDTFQARVDGSAGGVFAAEGNVFVDGLGCYWPLVERFEGR